MSLPPIILKEEHNYAAFFLTLSCNLKCPYCINHHNGAIYKNPSETCLTVDEWITAANRLVLREDLPLTLQGGEPTIYKGFYRFVNEVKENIKMDLLTNMTFDADDFIRNVPVWRFTREAPYAPIRASYHPGQNNIEDLIKKTIKLQNAGFRVGLYGIDYPENNAKKHIREVQKRCQDMGIDFRLKEFLGRWNGSEYGTFKYKKAVCGNEFKNCECKTTELLVDPGGYVYKCHSDLYKGRSPVGHILDKKFSGDDISMWRSCSYFGDCNPCDVKIKTNRFQIFGHTSVEIRNIEWTDI